MNHDAGGSQRSVIMPLLALAEKLEVSRQRIAGLLLLYLAGVALEGFGISMLLPIFNFVQSEGSMAELNQRYPAWQYVEMLYAKLGVDVTFASLAATSFIFIALRQAAVYTRLYFSSRYLEGALATGRNLAFSLFLNARLAYVEQAMVGNIVNDLTTEIRSAVYNMFGLISIMGNIIVAFGYFTILLLLSAEMTLVGVACLLVAYAILARMMRRSRQVGQQVTRANQAMVGFLVERLRSLRLIRLSGTEAAEFRAMHALTGRQREQIVKLQMLGARVTVLIDPILIIMAFTFLYFGTAHFGLGLGEIGLFLVALIRMMPLVEDLLKNRQALLGNFGAAQAVLRRLDDLAAAKEPQTGTTAFPALKRAIRLRDVQFSYGGETAALRGVTADIPAGKITALVGPSGAGKSTLIDLLPRLREIQHGEIFFDDTEARDLQLAELRRNIAYAPQAPQIFNITPAEHIRLGHAEASDAEVAAAAHLAGADGFITELPEGFGTLLGEGGVRLSGGQRQRLDLARVLASKAKIVVLDEPTSNLDVGAEIALRNSLQRIREIGEKTIIVVAHRLSTVAAADHIIVLEAGRVSAVGTHDELAKSPGWYANALAATATPALD